MNAFWTRRRLLKASSAALATPALMSSSFRARAQGAKAFKVGALHSMTGNSQSFGPGMQATVILGAEHINAAGGAGGRMLEVVTADDQTLPEPAVLAARKLVNVDGCQAIIGTLTSPVTLAVLKAVTEPNQLIHTHVSGAESLLTGYGKHVFKFGQSAGSYGRIYARMAHDMGFKKPVVMALNNESATSLANYFNDRWVGLGHAKPQTIIYDGSRPSYRSELQSALRSNPDVIILAAYLEDSTIILREWYQTGLQTKFMVAPYSLDERVIKTLGNDVVEGLYFGSAVFPTANPAFGIFDAAYRKKMNQPALSNRFTPDTWDMMMTMGLAMEITGPTATPVEIAAKMYTVANGPGKAVASFAEGKEALKSGPIKYVGAGSNLKLNEHGVDTASSFMLNTIKAGQTVAVKEVADI
jgi:branched-chain amino acid transport system substrate-binding protein